MKTLPKLALSLGLLSTLFLAGCYAPPTPPPPRVATVYQPPVYQPPKTAVLFVTNDTGLTTEQIEARRADAMRYLRNNGYLRDEELLVDDPAHADRIIRVSPNTQPGGGYHVRVFTPAQNQTSNSHSLLDDDWHRPRPDVTIYRTRPLYPRYYDPFYRDPLFYDPFDPWFGSSFNFFYHRNYYSPVYPRYYSPPRHHHRRHHGTGTHTPHSTLTPPSGSVESPPPATSSSEPAPARREPLNRPRPHQP